MKQEILLIDAPAGVLEVDAIWQSGERQTKDGLAILCHPNPIQGGTMNNKVVSTIQLVKQARAMVSLKMH